jgi:hypothetical protein
MFFARKVTQLFCLVRAASKFDFRLLINRTPSKWRQWKKKVVQWQRLMSLPWSVPPPPPQDRCRECLRYSTHAAPVRCNLLSNGQYNTYTRADTWDHQTLALLQQTHCTAVHMFITSLLYTETAPYQRNDTQHRLGEVKLNNFDKRFIPLCRCISILFRYYHRTQQCLLLF